MAIVHDVMTLTEAVANIEHELGEEFYSVLGVGVSSTRDTLKRKRMQARHRKNLGEALGVLNKLKVEDFFEDVVAHAPPSFTVVTVHDFNIYISDRLKETGLFEKIAEILTKAAIDGHDIERSFRFELNRTMKNIDSMCEDILAYISREEKAGNVTRLLNVYSSMRMVREQMDTIRRSRSEFDLGKDVIYLFMTMIKISQYLNEKSDEENFLRDIQMLSELSLRSRPEYISEQFNVYELAKSGDN